jgi:glycosyltransferase involved in cell wall biosynthesis
MDAFVVTSLLGCRGGAYLAPLLLCRQLAEMGLRVTCFAQYQELVPGPKPLPFDIIGPSVRHGCRWDLPGRVLAWQVARAIRRRRPDLVFVCGVTPLAGYLLNTRIATELLVWEFSNATPGNKFVDARARSRLGRARAVLSPSAAIDREIRKNYGYQGRLLRLPFWIEEDEKQKGESRKQEPEDRRQKTEVREGEGKQKAESRKLKARESDLRSPVSGLRSPRSASADFIYLGRRDVEKGLHELVRATAEVAKSFPGVRVLITGSGSEEPFSALAAELGVTGNIRFQYYPSHADTLAALANSRCLVLPSYHEGYPLVLLEAAQLGVPFIATQVGSVAEVFDGTGAGLIVPPRDNKALADAMLALLQEPPGRYRERCAAAYEVFRRTSSKAAVENSLQRVLEELKQC